VQPFLVVGCQEEDREILHAALQCRGSLPDQACAELAARLGHPEQSWPLPRTARQVEARLEWLAARMVAAKKGHHNEERMP
jgi:hypothetical protein